jgi:hypothetical protein
MSEWFRAGGVMMWPILGTAVLVLGAAAQEGWKLWAGRGRGAAEAEPGVVLAWGGLGAVLGVLGTLVGWAMMANAAERVTARGGVQPALLWGGLKVSLTTSIFGFLVLGVSLLMWFGLRALRARTGAEESAPAS